MVTLSGHPQNANFENISTKCIFVIQFSLLVHEMCVLNTKKLVIAYSFILMKRPKMTAAAWHQFNHNP